MTRVSFVMVALLAGFASMLSGCASLTSPTVTLESATVRETTDEAAALDLELRLQNPNNESLELLEFDYTVSVNGQKAFDGRWSSQMTLARLSTRSLTLPAVLVFEELNWDPQSIPLGAIVRLNGSLRYVQPGALATTLFDTGIRRPRASFRGEKPMSASNTLEP